MAKVKISKDGVTREIPEEQWSKMQNDKGTYGWVRTSDLPTEVSEKEKEISNEEALKLSDFKNQLLAKENSLKEKEQELIAKENSLKDAINLKDKEIAELKNQINSLVPNPNPGIQVVKPENPIKDGKISK